MSEIKQALMPFAALAEHAIENVNGTWVWKNNTQNERICDWFGPSDFGAALSSASALTAGEREPVGVRCIGCGSSWDDERLAKERLNNPAIRSCCPERDPQPVYYSPPASELEALRKETANTKTALDCALIREGNEKHNAEISRQNMNAEIRVREAAEARLAEALKALEHCEELLMRHQINHALHEEISDAALELIRAARRVREGGKVG